MGLLDRLKKKASSNERPPGDETEQDEFGEDSLLNDEEDLFSDSESLEELDESDEFDSLELENTDDVPEENQIQASTANSKRSVIAGIIVVLLLGILIGLGLWFYLSSQKFPLAEDLTKKFFKALNDGDYNRAYSMMDKPYREKINNNNFRLLLRSSAFYFDQINNIDFEEKNFNSWDDNASLSGSLEYVGKAQGNFELKFILRKLGKSKKLFITGFQVNSEDRKRREEKAAHTAVTEFLGTFSKDRATVFEGFFHPKRLESWGMDKRLKLLKLHSRLIDIGFVEHKFKPTDYKAKANVERVYFGKSKTKLGNEMNANVTVFYEKGNWFVTHLDFKPQ
tara:strand:+ start:105 stop:1118 length:1014 start_codon:yes stop_codon:yes gene_type:complete